MEKTINNQNSTNEKSRNVFSFSIKILSCLLVFTGLILFFAAKWYINLYGQQGFAAILYTLRTGACSAEKGLIRNFVIRAVCPTVLISAVFAFAIFIHPKKLFKNNVYVFPLKSWISLIAAAVIFFISVSSAAKIVGLGDFLTSLYSHSTIYENEYVDPDDVVITFPEEKQNLIYIYLESMETTFFDTEHGGVMEENLIPELYALAEENVNFSQNSSVGGGLTAVDTTWTIAAMVAQSAGIPLSIHHYGTTSISLPGLTALGDILNENGYYQALMLGSDAAFANRDEYYSNHGVDIIYDYYSAIEDEIIPEDYYVWWGMEDEYLFEYAKQELTEIAKQDQPFAFTLLTADTHFPGGYVCDLCDDKYERQYDNVYSCSSRQVAEFVKWIQRQDFYENTTIVLVGDHKTMDSEYIQEVVTDSTYIRRVYNCIINLPTVPADSKNREFTTLDMFPTTLAALGCTIEGDRLGLGVNLFSEEQTLVEKYGLEAINDELERYSSYFADNFVFE